MLICRSSKASEWLSACGSIIVGLASWEKSHYVSSLRCGLWGCRSRWSPIPAVLLVSEAAYSVAHWLFFDVPEVEVLV